MVECKISKDTYSTDYIKGHTQYDGNLIMSIQAIIFVGEGGCSQWNIIASLHFNLTFTYFIILYSSIVLDWM